MPAPRALSLREIAAVVAGNWLEFYDFLVFAFFAGQIGQVLFPPGHNRLLLALATFGVGFMTRPLGGLVIGRLGDRAGRKPAMLVSMGLMGGSVLGMAAIPPYARIGLAAPALAVGFRLLQGFALGGEVGPSTAFLMEAAPAGARGLYVSLQFATQQAATLAAGLVGLCLAHLMGDAALTQWGWRIAMVMGTAVVPFGLMVRRGLPETFASPAPVRVGRGETRLAILGLFMLGADTIATYTMNYMVTFGGHTLGLPPAVAFGATVTTGLCGTILNPVGGWLSDRLGRKPVMLAGMALLMVAALPCFIAMATLRSASVLFAGSALMAALLALATPAILTGLSENLPHALRAGGIGIVYAVAISLFGGTAQFAIAWLTQASGSPLAPAWYMTGALAAGIAAMAAMRETAPTRTGR